MPNIYRLEATMDALARQFGGDPAPELPVPSPVRPDEPGLIVRGVSGQRSLPIKCAGPRGFSTNPTEFSANRRRCEGPTSPSASACSRRSNSM